MKLGSPRTLKLPGKSLLSSPALADALVLSSAALILVAAQVFPLLLMSNATSFRAAYSGLCNWDCGAFARIAVEGYPLTVSYPPPPYHDLGHFPGLPSLASFIRLVANLFSNMGGFTATVLASQLAAFGFWIYFFLILKVYFPERPTWPMFWLGALAIIAYPESFFLVVGYSESVFLCGFLGLLYWSSRKGRLSLQLAIAHGIVMSSSRMVALPMVALPFMQTLGALDPCLNWKSRIRPLARPSVISLASSLGALSYLIFCELQYGHWDMYFRALESGWKMSPDYGFLFKLKHYRFSYPNLRDTTALNRMAYPLISLILFMLVTIELWWASSSTKDNNRFLFYAAATLLWFFSAAGAALIDMESMLRYGFCIEALLILGFLPTLIDLAQTQFRNLCIGAAIFFSSLGLLLGGGLAHLYLTGRWAG